MPVHNTMTDLHNTLFAELERLTDEDVSGEDLKLEISRANAVTKVSQAILYNSQLALDVARFHDEKLGPNDTLPHYLES